MFIHNSGFDVIAWKTRVSRAASCAAALVTILTTAAHAQEPTPAEREARAAFGQSFPATIVCDSNRGGTFGIYRMDIETWDLRSVIDGPDHEMVPRPSPKVLTVRNSVRLCRSRPHSTLS